MEEKLKIVISAEIKKLKERVQQAKKEILQFKDRVKAAKKEVSEDFKKMGEAMKAGIQKGVEYAKKALAGLGIAFGLVTKGTEEYRNQQAQLQTAFENAGGSAEAATETYNALYRVLGDGGQATEAAQHLAQLTTNQEELAQWTTICQGVYATFGSSLPIEALTEAANETAKTGEITGALADALNWAGVSEEAFQAALDACNTEAEREALIRKVLNSVYADAAAQYEENNAAVLEQRDAQAKLQKVLGDIGAALTPVITAFTSLAADALAVVAPYIKDLAEKAMPKLKELLDGILPTIESMATWIKEHTTLLTVLASIIGMVTTAITLYNAAAAIKALMDEKEVATVSGLITAYLAKASAIMLGMLPYLLIIATIALVVAAFMWLWNNCDSFRQFWVTLWETLKEVFATFVESLKPMWDSIVGIFVEAWEIIKFVWNLVAPFFEGIWNAIKTIFSTVAHVLGENFKGAWKNICIVWDVAVSYFTTIWDTVRGVFSVVKHVLSGNFKDAWEAIKGIFAGWGSFFTGLWDSIKAIFSNIAQTVGGAIQGTVAGAVNAVLSTAAGIINAFINGINAAIGIINAIPGVSIGYLKPLSVPAMAKGGIVDSATLAVVGEQGKEAVVPLENNLEWLDKLAGMLNDRMGGNQPIVINVDGKRFGEIAVDSINGITRQRGNIPLVIA